MNYRIKPLEWEKVEHSYPDVLDKFEAYTALASFEVESMPPTERAPQIDYYYSFCFREYYDDGSGKCESIEDGKAKCTKIWEDRLKNCLIEED